MSDLGEIFSRKQRVGGIEPPAKLHVAADAAERAGLAKIFGLPGIAALCGDFSFTESGTEAVIDAELKLHAKVTQTCVITLENFDAMVVETARLRFVPAASLSEDIAELAPESLEGPDEIPYAGDAIDLGSALAEQLALALDPYPRKPGAQLPAGASNLPSNPFAALAARRGKPANDAQ